MALNDPYTGPTQPSGTDTLIPLLKKICALLYGAFGPGGTGGGGGGTGSAPIYVGSTPTQSTLSNSAATIIAASASAQKVCIFNNSGTDRVTILIGSGTPVNDSGTISTPNGDGYGTEIYPKGYYESPEAFKEGVQAISTGSTTKITITLFTSD